MSVGNGVHLGFVARTKDQVHKFHTAALAHGGSNNGEPGPRPDYGARTITARLSLTLTATRSKPTLHAAPKTQAARQSVKMKAAKRKAAKKKSAKKAAKKPVKKKAKKKKSRR